MINIFHIVVYGTLRQKHTTTLDVTFLIAKESAPLLYGVGISCAYRIARHIGGGKFLYGKTTVQHFGTHQYVHAILVPIYLFIGIFVRIDQINLLVVKDILQVRLDVIECRTFIGGIELYCLREQPAEIIQQVLPVLMSAGLGKQLAPLG